MFFTYHLSVELDLTHSKQMPSADDISNFSTLKKKKKMMEIQIFIATFKFIMKNAFIWVQTSLVLVQWFLR